MVQGEARAASGVEMRTKCTHIATQEVQRGVLVPHDYSRYTSTANATDGEAIGVSTAPGLHCKSLRPPLHTAAV